MFMRSMIIRNKAFSNHIPAGKTASDPLQSLLSDLSDGMNLDSSPAKNPVFEVVALFRVGLLLVGLVD